MTEAANRRVSREGRGGKQGKKQQRERWGAIEGGSQGRGAGGDMGKGCNNRREKMGSKGPRRCWGGGGGGRAHIRVVAG